MAEPTHARPRLPGAPARQVSGKWLLPREHGGWGIVLIPFLTAVAIAGNLSIPVVLALATVLLVFVARYPLELLLLPGLYRRAGSPSVSHVQTLAWTYSLLAASVGLLLVVVWKLYLLLWLALVGGVLFAGRVWWGRKNSDRNLGAELTGTGALTLSALVGWLAATGELNRTGLLVWGLNGVFFCSGILYVKSRIRARLAVHRLEENPSAAFALSFHFLVLLFVLALVFARWISPLIVVPFALAAVRVTWGLRSSHKPFALRRLGWSEVALSLLFATFMTLGFRL